jgi:hypothetical protein
MTGASHLLARGRSGAARGSSEPLIAVLGLPLRELRMLANHGWPHVEKQQHVSEAILTYLAIHKNKILEM